MCSLFVPVENPGCRCLRHQGESRKTRLMETALLVAARPARRPGHRRRSPSSSARPRGAGRRSRAPRSLRPSRSPRRSSPTSASSNWARGSQAMGELLAKAQTQLQSSVHERLDAVTQHLGTSMQTATKHTTENLQKLNERLAVIDNAQKNITDLASQVTSLRERAGQQADARRVRPGPHGSDHPGRPAEGRLRIPVHAHERQAAGLRGAAAGPAAAGDRREIPARSGHRVPRRQDRRRAQVRRAARAAGRDASTSTTSPRNI